MSQFCHTMSTASWLDTTSHNPSVASSMNSCVVLLRGTVCQRIQRRTHRRLTSSRTEVELKHDHSSQKQPETSQSVGGHLDFRICDDEGLEVDIPERSRHSKISVDTWHTQLHYESAQVLDPLVRTKSDERTNNRASYQLEEGMASTCVRMRALALGIPHCIEAEANCLWQRKQQQLLRCMNALCLPAARRNGLAYDQMSAHEQQRTSHSEF